MIGRALLRRWDTWEWVALTYPRRRPCWPVPPGAHMPTNPETARRAEISAHLWQIAEQHIVAEWICCEPIDPAHDLCVQGGAALQMLKALLVDDPEAWKPAPLLDEVMRLLPPTGSVAEAHRLSLSQALDVGSEFVRQADHPDAAGLDARETDLAQSGVDTPGCDCGHDGMGPKWHSTSCEWRSIPPCDHCGKRGHSFEDCPRTGAPWDAIHERVQELRRMADERDAADAYDRALRTPPSAETCAALRERLASGQVARRKVRRRMADEEPAETNKPSPTEALLALRCDACRHTLNRHHRHGACTVVLCVCGRFQYPVEELPQ